MKTGLRRSNLGITAVLLALGLGAALILPGYAAETAKTDKVEIPVFIPPVWVTLEEVSWKNFGPPVEKLVKEGKYGDALARYIWYYQYLCQLEHTDAPGAYSYSVLKAWSELGKKNPPALAALRELRGNIAEALLTNKLQLEYHDRDWEQYPARTQEDWNWYYRQKSGDSWRFSDLTSIDKLLGESEKSYQFFLELDRVQPVWAKKVWFYAERMVVDHDNLELALKYTPDLKLRWKIQTTTMDEQLKGIRRAVAAGPYSGSYDYVLSYPQIVLKIFRASTKPEDVAFTRECEKEFEEYRQQVAKLAKENQDKKKEGASRK